VTNKSRSGEGRNPDLFSLLSFSGQAQRDPESKPCSKTHTLQMVPGLRREDKKKNCHASTHWHPVLIK
jgi:hypothetical protein